MTPGAYQVSRIPFLLVLVTLCSFALPPRGHCQSFAQVLDLGSDVGARLTRAVTLNRINSSLFATPFAQVNWVDATGATPVVFSFATDPVWSKVVFSRGENWLRGFNDWSDPVPLIAPRGLDVSGSRKIFITDPPTGRVLVVTLDESTKRLARVAALTTGLTFPVSVAWDGGSSPLTGEALYVLDGATSAVSYWTKSGSTWTRAWSYGQSGSGTGQFSGPSDVCVRRSASSPSASSTFGTDFYVVDAGNRRIVWLKREGTSATWKRERSLPEGWRPVACTVDHFGVVYVADQQNSQLVSYTWFLDEVTRYGSYGTGATNYNTFAHPHDVHIPFGKKTVGGQTIWYGEGRILTAEDWGPDSGGLEHWLGVEIPVAWATPTAWGPQVDWRTTGMAYNTVTVYQGTHKPWETTPYRTVWQQYLLSPSWIAAVWDGTAPDTGWAPVGTYHFHVRATSAYGCQGEPWCDVTVVTGPVSWEGPGSCEWPDEYCIPCEQNVALLPDVPVGEAALPAAYRLGQVLTAYQGPLLRREGLPGASASRAGVPGIDPVASVRAYGIRALALDIPRAGDGLPVSVRIYALDGRLVRVLVQETVAPGSYVVGWDGEDAAGRPVQPGVYVAVMTAAGYRGVQRLLVK
jgi:hypothetical protein